MGRSVSSKHARSRDIADCVADDYVAINPSLMNRNRKLKTSVKLISQVRTADMDNQAAFGYSSGATGQVPLDRRQHLTFLSHLLTETIPIQWQEALHSLLKVYIPYTELVLALTFLQSNMDAALQAVENPGSSPGYPAIYINVRQKPCVFPVELWKRIMLGLHFDLTEPDCSSDIDLIEICITPNVTPTLLTGFKYLLHNLLALNWDMLWLVKTLERREGQQLLSKVQGLLEGNELELNGILQPLLERYPSQFSTMGFYAERSHHKTSITWKNPQTNQIVHMELSLLGIFHNGEMSTHI